MIDIRHTIAMVAGETLVDFGLLVENEDFMEYLLNTEPTYEELVDWVNNNY